MILISQEGNRSGDGHEEHLTRFYDQKMVAFKAQVIDLQEKLKYNQGHYTSDLTLWKKTETELTQKNDRLSKEILHIKETLALLQEENQDLRMRIDKNDNIVCSWCISEGFYSLRIKLKPSLFDF